MDDIKEVFGNITQVDIENTGCLAFNQMILQNFFPIEELTIRTENFQDWKIPQSLLVQKFVRLNLIDSGLDVSITLNDLLFINSQGITVENPQMPQKLLNKFIKLWQKGSNPHMEYLCIHYFGGEEHDKEIVLRGIKHNLNPLDQVKKFKVVGYKCPIEARGGMDVYRKDGVKATITYEISHEYSIWDMFVWMDHCVVE
ncbi:hypothetical protein CAEBREN_02428 [Caenorhabditis brenneri]|uniref:Sdz-33 F-box domain-containing protein n=1 Tax=Caenorhabditis brenneri TaxID=135651 RepID=G0N0H3_CAEBE|nr:hypothetical protein CAEBREN_02428 [Caenorhabditis brenneri]